MIRLEYDRLKPYLKYIAEYSESAQMDPFLIAGLLLRESGASYSPGYHPRGSLEGWGDRGNAYSPWQFDLRDPGNAMWIGTPESKTMDGQLKRVATYLYEARKMLEWALSGETLERAILAAYNADARKVLHSAYLCDVDRCTTNRDYSQWIINKAAELKKLNPDMFREVFDGIA